MQLLLSSGAPLCSQLALWIVLRIFAIATGLQPLSTHSQPLFIPMLNDATFVSLPPGNSLTSSHSSQPDPFYSSQPPLVPTPTRPNSHISPFLHTTSLCLTMSLVLPTWCLVHPHYTCAPPPIPCHPHRSSLLCLRLPCEGWGTHASSVRHLVTMYTTAVAMYTAGFMNRICFYNTTHLHSVESPLHA